MVFPASEGTNSYGALSIPSATQPSSVRRTSGVSPISASLSSSNPLVWDDIKIGLDMNLTGLNNYYTKTEVNKSLALKAPINNPTFTGTLYCPQLTSWPTPQLYDFNIVKASGLYHYDSYGSATGLRNAPTNSANLEALKLVMITDAHRLPCLGILINFLRMIQDSSFTPWREVIHSGNINTLIQPSLNAKQDRLLFPFEDAFNGWRLLSDDSIARRLTSDDKIQVTRVLDFVSGGSITDIKIGLNMNLT